MRNIYQERELRRKGMAREDWDDYGDHMYHLNKELDEAEKRANLMDRFYDELREPKKP